MLCIALVISGSALFMTWVCFIGFFTFLLEYMYFLFIFRPVFRPYSRADGGAGLPPLRDTAQVLAIKHLPNTENILPGCLCHVFVAAAAPSPAALNKYISLRCCQRSSFKSDECISALGFIITSVKIAVVLTITYENRYGRQDGCLSVPWFLFFLNELITHN